VRRGTATPLAGVEKPEATCFSPIRPLVSLILAKFVGEQGQTLYQLADPPSSRSIFSTAKLTRSDARSR
jgi:hypothetical protein